MPSQGISIPGSRAGGRHKWKANFPSQAVVESYVLREGTDYGEKEFSLQDKVAHVISRLKRGEARIVFDPESETVSIINV